MKLRERKYSLSQKLDYVLDVTPLKAKPLRKELKDFDYAVDGARIGDVEIYEIATPNKKRKWLIFKFLGHGAEYEVQELGETTDLYDAITIVSEAVAEDFLRKVQENASILNMELRGKADR